MSLAKTHKHRKKYAFYIEWYRIYIECITWLILIADTATICECVCVQPNYNFSSVYRLSFKRFNERDREKIKVVYLLFFCCRSGVSFCFGFVFTIYCEMNVILLGFCVFAFLNSLERIAKTGKS